MNPLSPATHRAYPIRFGGPNTLVKLVHVPTLIGVKAQYEADTECRARILLSDAQQELANLQDILKKGSEQQRTLKASHPDPQTAARIYAKVGRIVKTRIQGIQTDIAKLQKIVETPDSNA